MRILHCHIFNFGCLREERFSFGEGITVLCRRNGSGKSTLADFLLVMFYGFADEAKRDNEKRQRERYRPWQGGIYGGEVVFSAGKVRYRMTRTFGRTPAEDRFTLLNEDTKLPDGRYSGQIGRELFGVDRESFLRTAFAGQLQSYRPGRTDDMNARLGGISADEEDLNHYETAREILKRWLNQNSPSRKNGRINALRRQIEGMSGLAHELEDAERRIEEHQRSLDACEQQLREKNGQLHGLLAEQRSLAARQDLQLQQERRRSLCLREAQAREELLQAQSFFPDPDHMPRTEKIDELLLLVQRELIPAQTIWALSKEAPSAGAGDVHFALVILAALFAAAAGIFLIQSRLWWLSVLLVLVGIGIAILALLLYPRAAGKQRRRRTPGGSLEPGAGRQAEQRVRQITERIEGYLQSVGFAAAEDLTGTLTRIRDALRREQLCAEQWQRASEALQHFDAGQARAQTRAVVMSPAAGTDVTGGTVASERAVATGNATAPESTAKSMTQLQERIEALRHSLRSQEQTLEKLREALAAALERREGINAALQERERLAQTIAGQEEAYRLVLRTDELLREAKDALTASYTEPVMKRFLHYYGNGDTMTMDANGQLTIAACGHVRPADLMSTGQRDLIGLCLRAAQLDVMYPDEKPFLLLDDPFVNLDRENKERAGEVLRELASRYQIFYLTCSEELPGYRRQM